MQGLNQGGIHKSAERSPPKKMEKKKSALSRAASALVTLVKEISLLGQVGLTLLCVIGVFGVLGFRGLSIHGQGILDGNEISLILATTTLTAFLAATMGLVFVAQSNRIAANEAKIAEYLDGASTLSEAINASFRDLTHSHDAISESVDRILVRSGSNWFRMPNDNRTWSALAPDTVYFTIQGRCWGEVRAVRDADGEVSYEVNVKMIDECWVPRFSAGSALARVNHIIFADEEDNSTPDSVLRLLGSYRATQCRASQLGLNIDLSTVRIFMVDKKYMIQDAIFIGSRTRSIFRHTQTPFVQKYTCIPLQSAGTINAEVEVNLAPEMVASYTNIATELIELSSRGMTLDEAEERYGKEVPTLSNLKASPLVSVIESSPRFGTRHDSECFDQGDGSIYV